MKVRVPSKQDHLPFVTNGYIEGTVIKIINGEDNDDNRYILDTGEHEVEVPIHLAEPLDGFTNELIHQLIYAGLQPMTTDKEDL
jgi:hypothetical protein